MTIDLQEKYLTAKEVAAIVPGRPGTGAIWRWMHRGFRGQVLPSITCAGKRLVRERDLHEFLEAVSKPVADTSGKSARKTRRRASEAAERELAAAGA